MPETVDDGVNRVFCGKATASMQHEVRNGNCEITTLFK